MTVAFSEMMTLIANQDKESKIVIKTGYVEWYFYLIVQFSLIPKTWLTRSLLARSGIDLTQESYSLLNMILFEYHNLALFSLWTIGLLLFVVSLQEGFYAYQFKQLGWTLMSALAIVAGVTGLIVSLWRCTLWAFFALMAVCIHNAADYAVNRWSPSKTRMLLLKPEATYEGFMVGVFAVFAFFTFVSVLS